MADVKKMMSLKYLNKDYIQCNKKLASMDKWKREIKCNLNKKINAIYL